MNHLLYDYNPACDRKLFRQIAAAALQATILESRKRKMTPAEVAERALEFTEEMMTAIEWAWECDPTQEGL